jgi:S1-C subfamily serine protease
VSKQIKAIPIVIIVAMLALSACAPVSAVMDRVLSAANGLSTAPDSVANAPNQGSKTTSFQAQATQTPAAAVPSSASGGLLAAYEGTLEAVYTKVNPSVVNIEVTISGAGNSSNGFGSPNGQGSGQALGSGFVWDKQGHIVTNNHVVSQATQVTVTFADGNTATAKVVGTDPYADLAVIQVSVDPSWLQPVTLADSTQVKVGELAIAIGNPYGLSGTMTAGIISALSRSLPVESNTNSQFGASGPTYSIPDILQTDAAINPGNSGGVLVDENGQVLGVTAAIESNSQANSGIGFVIPAKIVSNVVPSLISTGKVDHPWLGITMVTLTPDIKTANNLNASQRGVMVVDVTASSPAEKAGLKGASNASAQSNGQNNQQGFSQIPTGGDVIVAVNGQQIKTSDDLISYLFENTKVGQTITLTVLRNGQQASVNLTLGARPSANQ